jgi:hypothetical protein
MINHGRDLLLEHYEKHHFKAAQRRLALAFLAVCAIATLFTVFAIEVCSGMCVFVPN